MILRAHRAGEEGFTGYLLELSRLRVLSRREALVWLAFHGAVMRLHEKPLDTGDGIDGDTLAELERELGS